LQRRFAQARGVFHLFDALGRNDSQMQALREGPAHRLHAAFNMSEQLALSINAGYTAGGLQIIGRRFYDAGVQALGAAREQLRPAQPPWPV
jgi:Asp-tRNA(Asn)/Glu-tRNA(Gln) amidotransferase A subunit family amidase